MKAIGRLFKGVLDRGWWPSPDVNGVRRMAQAECALPWVDPKYITGISVKNEDAEALVKRKISPSLVDVNVDRTLFFGAHDRHPITERLSLVTGDMFFSRMQTLTVSVNLKGVMGAGVALGLACIEGSYPFTTDYRQIRAIRSMLTIIGGFFCSLPKRIGDMTPTSKASRLVLNGSKRTTVKQESQVWRFQHWAVVMGTSHGAIWVLFFAKSCRRWTCR